MKNVTWIFKRNELVYDIKGRAYAMARAHTLKSDNPDRDDSWLMDVCQEQWPETMNKEIAGRIMTLAFHECKMMCDRALKGSLVTYYCGDDEYHDHETYKLSLQLQDKIGEGTIELLRDYVHEYIVYKVLLEWCRLVSRDHIDYLSALLDDIENKIKSLMMKVLDAGDRPYFPF